jgi:ABC-2 type transport system permease protein
VPAVIVVAIVTAAIAGTWTTLPAVLAAALGILLAGYGVSAVSSALLVVPVAKAGDSPFKTVPGQTFVNGLVVFLVLGVTIALAAPALVLAIVSTVTASAVLAWIALAVAVVAGAAIILGGIVVGGRTLERTGPDLLARIKAFPS